MGETVLERLEMLDKRLAEDKDFRTEFEKGYLQYINQKRIRYIYSIGPVFGSKLLLNDPGRSYSEAIESQELLKEG